MRRKPIIINISLIIIGGAMLVCGLVYGLQKGDFIVTSINGTNVTGGTVTISNASGNIGSTTDITDDSYSATPTAARAVSTGDIIRVDSNGGPTSQIDAIVLIEIDRDD